MSSPDPSPRPYDPSAGIKLPAVDVKQIAYAEIFPAIGIARVGNSGSQNGKRSGPVTYFLGPELPQTNYQPVGGYRDAEQKIKRQGARFRVYAYDPDGKLLGEINESNGYTLEWTVDVANMKAASTIFQGRLDEPTTQLRNPDIQPDLPYYLRDKLIVRPSEPVKVSGKDQSIAVMGRFQGSRKKPEDGVDVDLGDAKTDDVGRLIFVGGSGWSECVTKDTGYKPDAEYPNQPDIMSEMDNVDWVDSACDGRINVAFSKDGSTTRFARHQAWVLSGPPNFTWGIDSPTTLWDVMEDVYNKNSQSFVADPNAHFYRDIWPVLSGTYRLSWTNKDALQGHGPGGRGNFLEMENALKDHSQGDLRAHIFSRIRMPDYLSSDQASIKWMPRLSGDADELIGPGTIQTTSTFKFPISQFAALTTLQYDRFKRWKNGDFDATPFPASKYAKLEDVPLESQTEYITRAHLESAIGDPLYPGIETYWIAKTRDVYDFSVDNTVKPPFRVKSTLRPGDMTRGLCLPWQSDFSQCNQIWWPSARPDDVVPEQDFLNLVPHTVGGVGQGFNFATTLDSTPRRPWTRPMRITPDNDSQFFPGCTDMTRYWELLGFVTRIEIPGQPLPVYVEVQRRLPDDMININKELTDEDVQKALGPNSSWKLVNGRLVDKLSGAPKI